MQIYAAYIYIYIYTTFKFNSLDQASATFLTIRAIFFSLNCRLRHGPKVLRSLCYFSEKKFALAS